MYHSLDLNKRQQGFHDINFNGSKPSKALCVAYNGRDPFEAMVRTAVSNSDIAPYIEYERNAVGGNDRYIWSMKAVLDLAKEMFNSQVSQGSELMLTEYLNALIENTPILSALVFPTREPKEYRRDFLCGHSVMAVALGMLGQRLCSQHPTEWLSIMAKLKDSSLWYRDQGLFEGRCEINGRMKSSKSSAELAAFKLIELCGLEVDSFSKVREQELLLKHNVKNAA